MSEDVVAYVESLPLPSLARAEVARDPNAPVVDMEHLPDLVVAGSNLIEFDQSAPADAREAITGALLIAQLHADQVKPKTLTEWYDTYTSVLKRLGFRLSEDSRGVETFSNKNAAVHEAIIPLLVAAFGPGAVATSLIITTLHQLQQIDPDKKWITIFEERSKRLQAADFQFAAVQAPDGAADAEVRLAGATLSGEVRHTQVLFFSVDTNKTKLEIAKGKLLASKTVLQHANPKIQERLKNFVDDFVAAVDIGKAPN
jgi:hypothetical protein